MVFYIVVKVDRYLTMEYIYNKNIQYALLHSDYAIASYNAHVYGGEVKRVTIIIDT
jgi:hypothetical protein